MEKKGEKTRGSILGLGMDRGVGGIKGGGGGPVLNHM